MKLLLTTLLTIFIVSYAATAQDALAKPAVEKLTSGPEYEMYYNKLKGLEIKQLDTDGNEKYLNLHKEFVDKMFYTGDLAKIANNYLPWIIDNIEKTLFGSYEIAEMEWNRLVAAHHAIVTTDKEYHNFFQECQSVCNSKIFDEVLIEVMLEYPERFW